MASENRLSAGSQLLTRLCVRLLAAINRGDRLESPQVKELGRLRFCASCRRDRIRQLLAIIGKQPEGISNKRRMTPRFSSVGVSGKRRFNKLRHSKVVSKLDRKLHQLLQGQPADEAKSPDRHPGTRERGSQGCPQSTIEGCPLLLEAEHGVQLLVERLCTYHVCRCCSQRLRNARKLRSSRGRVELIRHEGATKHWHLPIRLQLAVKC